MLFALLFSSPEPVTLGRIRQILYPGAAGESAAADADSEGPGEAVPATDAAGDEEHHGPRAFLAALQEWMEARGLPLVLRRVGKAWRLLTSEDVAEDLEPVRRQARKERIGPAALEVLALVAWRQPVLKADIDAIRGVNSSSHLRHLLDLRLIRILGRAELPGRPFLYGTTREFLDAFGLADLSELPEAGRLAPPEPGRKPTPGGEAAGTGTPAEASPATAEPGVPSPPEPAEREAASGEPDAAARAADSA